jgi:leucyl aminopeptidase
VVAAHTAFDPVPSWTREPTVNVRAASPDAWEAVAEGEPLGVPVGLEGPVQGAPGLGRDALAAAGFTGATGQTLSAALPGSGVARAVYYGVGDAKTAAGLRDAAAAYALAVKDDSAITLAVPPTGLPLETVAQMLVEGVLLARYSYEPLKSASAHVPVGFLTLLVHDGEEAAAVRGAARGLLLARCTMLARDLANCPANKLTASAMAACATRLAANSGLEAEVFDEDQLKKLGCGGLLGVNAGSGEPARMIRLRYRPEGGSAADGGSGSGRPGKLALVGKGVMYDSGGISLKPSDAVHATMKNDMSGAAAILAAMAVLRDLGCRNEVTGYLMCTDNMPSGTATRLGDVLTIYGGSTVEVLNTDAEGRLVMADALVMARDEPVDAIVDIATLTGACLRALGPRIAGVFGDDQSLVDQIRRASEQTDEPTWQLPLAEIYREELDSDIADIKNIGSQNGAAIHAALFLRHFTGEVPWAHIDIAGPAQNERSCGWRPRGCTGFGARLLAHVATDFSAPRGSGRQDAARGEQPSAH